MKDKEKLLKEQQKETGVSRRTFLKTVTGTAAGIGISQMFNPALVSAMEKALEHHPVL